MNELHQSISPSKNSSIMVNTKVFNQFIVVGADTHSPNDCSLVYTIFPACPAYRSTEIIDCIMFIQCFLLLSKMHAQVHNMWSILSLGTVLRQCSRMITSIGATLFNSRIMVSHEKYSSPVLEFSRMIEFKLSEHSILISFRIAIPILPAAFITILQFFNNLFKTVYLFPLTKDSVSLFGVP